MTATAQELVAAFNGMKGQDRETDYDTFLESKRIRAEPCGFEVRPSDLNPMLFEWQRLITRTLLYRGRGALFADCGLGKTPMSLEWARHVLAYTQRPVLILTPLAVGPQFVREGEKFGVPVKLCRAGGEIGAGVNVTNYERLQLFDPTQFGGLVCDESSILKGDGPLRKSVCQFSRNISLLLAATATPAPNDVTELANHADFLRIMRPEEMLALWFSQDGNSTHSWRLKPHAQQAFWEWLASWAIAIRKPSDLGFPDDGFELPPLRLHQHVVEIEAPEGELFASEARGLNAQRKARRNSLEDRVKIAADLVNSSPEPWIAWCALNDESAALDKAIPNAVEVTGSDTLDRKEERLDAFSTGKALSIVTKAEIAGHGLNWQHCAKQVFVGLGNSWERYYQAIRRSLRYGQTRPVDIHIVVSEADGEVVRNIERKDREAAEMMAEVVKHMGALELGKQTQRDEMSYREDLAEGPDWKFYLGDSCKLLPQIETESVGLSVFSPPFPAMYAYTNSARDMGNCADFEEMIEHFSFILPELLRVTMPGRSCAIHLCQSPCFINKDGYAGRRDFRGRTIEAMEKAGWIYYGEHTIDKNPQVKAQRTKDRGLLFKTLTSDSSHLHAAFADYLIQFRKPGDNPVPIEAGKGGRYGGNGWITPDEWIRWARPVWYGQDWAPDGDGIRETDVLNVSAARDEEDERHLCPLQLGVIERAVKLWSNPSELVLSPFGGVGSELFTALKLGRRAVGIELKESYWTQGIKNCRRAIGERKQLSLAGMFEE